MGKVRNLLRNNMFSIFLFFLSLLFLNWPILTICNEDDLKTVFFYLFSVWFIIILLVFSMNRSRSDSSSDAAGTDKGDSDV